MQNRGEREKQTKKRRLGFRALERVFGNFILFYFTFIFSGSTLRARFSKNLGREEGPVPNAAQTVRPRNDKLGFDWMAKTFAGDPQQIQATLPRTEVSAWPIPRHHRPNHRPHWSQPLDIDMWPGLCTPVEPWS